MDLQSFARSVVSGKSLVLTKWNCHFFIAWTADFGDCHGNAVEAQAKVHWDDFQYAYNQFDYAVGPYRCLTTLIIPESDQFLQLVHDNNRLVKYGEKTDIDPLQTGVLYFKSWLFC